MVNKGEISFNWLFREFGGAGGEVVVDKAGGLEEGVADGGAEEFKSAALHVFGYCVGYGGCDGQVIKRFRIVDNGEAVAEE